MKLLFATILALAVLALAAAQDFRSMNLCYGFTVMRYNGIEFQVGAGIFAEVRFRIEDGDFVETDGECFVSYFGDKSYLTIIQARSGFCHEQERAQIIDLRFFAQQGRMLVNGYNVSNCPLVH